MRGQRRGDLSGERNVERGRGVLEPDLRRGRVHGNVCAGADDLLGQRGGDLPGERDLERGLGMLESDVRDGSVHGGLCAGTDDLLGHRGGGMPGERHVELGLRVLDGHRERDGYVRGRRVRLRVRRRLQRLRRRLRQRAGRQRQLRQLRCHLHVPVDVPVRGVRARVRPRRLQRRRGCVRRLRRGLLLHEQCAVPERAVREGHGTQRRVVRFELHDHRRGDGRLWLCPAGERHSGVVQLCLRLHAEQLHADQLHTPVGRDDRLQRDLQLHVALVHHGFVRGHGANHPHRRPDGRARPRHSGLLEPHDCERQHTDAHRDQRRRPGGLRQRCDRGEDRRGRRRGRVEQHDHGRVGPGRELQLRRQRREQPFEQQQQQWRWRRGSERRWRQGRQRRRW